MATTLPPRTERPRFYEQQYLGARDMTRIVDYFREGRARHDLGAHIWGIAAGLQLIERPSKCGGPLEVYLEPGFAWDGFGRPIVVLAPMRVSPALFASLTYEASDAGPPPGRPVPVWLRYRESPVCGPPPGFEICSEADQYSRTAEMYEIVAGERPAHGDRHDPVSVAGYELDARDVPAKLEIPGPVVGGVATTATLDDESIPYQTFPDEADSRWLIPLGVVRWLPPNGAAAGGFQARVESPNGPHDLTIHERARRYVGVVAGTVNAAGSTIRLRSRDGNFTPQVWTSELAWIEGNARVDGNISLLDGRVVFRDANYSDYGEPLSIGRREANALGGRDLVVGIGAHEAGANRLVVGPYVAPAPGGEPILHEKVVVKDDGSVGIGETNPNRPLVVRGRGADAEAIGLEDAAGTTRWSLALNAAGVAGLHIREVGAAATRLYVKDGGDVGVGTTAPTQNLHVQGSRGIRQNELYISGGDGNRWSSFSFNAHHNAANTGWVFPNPGRRAITLEMDDSGGAPRYEVWSTTSANPIGFIRRLAIDGENGTMLLAPNGGDVGVGTNAPQNHLHVDGGSGLRVGRLHMSGGGGGDVGSSIGFNSYRNAANSAFVFPDPARAAVTVEMDDTGGAPRFQVWSTTNAAKNVWQERLHVNGETGDFVVAHTGGKAGIGTLQPTTKLHVAGAIAGAASDINNHVAIIENTSGFNADVLALKVGTAAAIGNNNFITFFAGGTAIGAIEGDNVLNGIVWNSGGADVAEWIQRAEGEPAMRAGDVVGIQGGRVSRRIEGAERLMVVSTSPMILGNRPPDDVRDQFERVVFIGRAPVRVRGPVSSGDIIVAEEDGDGIAFAVPPDSLALRDLPRVVAVAWDDAVGPGPHAVKCGVGLPPPRHVWSLIAAAITPVEDAPERRTSAAPARRRRKPKRGE